MCERIHERGKDMIVVEDISTKPFEGSKRRDGGFDDEQPQRLPESSSYVSVDN